MSQQKLAFTDFSGGITENFIPGKPNSYRSADNIWITRDAHMESRPGSTILGSTNYLLPNGGIRVNHLINFQNDSELFAVSGPDLFYQTSTPAWLALTGPAGSPAFTLNTAENKVAWAEWKGHLFLTPDGGGLPQKIYRDETNTLRLRQAGLPKPVFSEQYTTDELLGQAVALAVEIRDKMVLHFLDGGSSSYAHSTVQSTTALAALTAPTSTATLITYIAQLVTDYNTHIADAQDVNGGQVYHANIAESEDPGFFMGRYPLLNLELDSEIPTPTTLVTCVSTLNDLRNKYNWHTYATFTHWTYLQAGQLNELSGGSYVTNVTGLGLNVVTTPMITNEVAPLFSGQLSTLFAYVNNLKEEFNTHIGAFNAIHQQEDTDNAITVSDCTDAFGAVTLINHLAFYYFYHYIDTVYKDEDLTPQAFYPFTGTFTSGSATATGTSLDGSAYVGAHITPYYWTTSGGTTWNRRNSFTGSVDNVKVSSGTATTIIFSATSAFNYTSPTETFALTYAKYHLDYTRNLVGQLTWNDIYNRFWYEPSRNQKGLLDYSLATVSAISTQAGYLAGLLKDHEIDGLVLNSDIDTTIEYYKKDTTVTQLGTVATGYRFNVHTTLTAYGNRVPVAGQEKGYFEATPSVVSKLYTVVWRYGYSVGQIDFEDDSTPATSVLVNVVLSTKAPDPSTDALYPITLTNLPTLANSSGSNYDTANIYLDVYSTIGNGQSFFLVGSVANGTTTFTDSVVDADLPTKQELYTTGGVVGNDTPPQAKYVHILNGTAYYGNIVDTNQQFNYRVRQSIQNDPDSCPATFFDDLDDEITGLSSWRNYVIVLCKNSFYRMEGGFNELGQGALTHEKLSDTVGCVSHSSIVRTEFGIFFAGTNGIYWTDGYQFTRLTTELETTYAALIQSDRQKARISGTYMKSTRRVVWSMMSSSTGQDCDIAWVLDLNWGITEKATFTTFSGGTSFAPSALAFYAGQLIRGDSRGYVFKHDPSYKSDLHVDTTVAATSWRKQPLIYTYEGCATDFGSAQAKKWVTKVSFQGKNEGNLSLQISYKSDNNRHGWRNLTPIRYRSNCVWGDPAILWNNATTGPLTYWGPHGTIDAFRRMPQGAIRCEWKAIRFTNASVVIANSDTYGTAVSGALTAGAIALTFTSSTYVWPLNAVGNYTVSFSNDSYVKTYAVSVRTGTTLTILDPNATAPASSIGLKWTINGIPVDEKISLLSYDMTYAGLGDQKSPYQGATSSDGGQNS